MLVVFTLSDESVIKSSDILRLIKTEDDITHKQMEVVTWFNEYVHMLDDGTDIFSIIYYCGENQIWLEHECTSVVPNLFTSTTPKLNDFFVMLPISRRSGSMLPQEIKKFLGP